MPTSAARWNGCSAWWTAACCWSTPPRGRCRRPSSCWPRRWRPDLRPSSWSTRWTSRTRARSRCRTRPSTCSPRSTPTNASSTSRPCSRQPRRAGPRPRPTARATGSVPCSRPSWSACRRPMPLRTDRLPWRQPFWSRTPIWAGSSRAGSRAARSAPTGRSMRSGPAKARWSAPGQPACWRFGASTACPSSAPSRATSLRWRASRRRRSPTRWPRRKSCDRCPRGPSIPRRWPSRSPSTTRRSPGRTATS